MRAIFAIVFVAGLGLAALAANMVKSYMASQHTVLQAERAAAAQRVDVVPVVAVKAPVKYGQQLTPNDVQVIAYAKTALPKGTFSSLDAFFSKGGEVPRTVLRPMEALEPVLAVKVTEPGADAGLVTRLGKGMRAFAIRTDVSSGVSGFLRPGDRADVYWTGHVSGREGGSEITRLIQPAIEIMAVDQTDDTTRDGAKVARTVTVKADPQQVAALAQAQSTGRLSLALVGVADETVSEVIEVDQKSLLGIADIAAPAAAPASAPQICSVRHRKGAELVVMQVPCTN